MRHTSNNRDNGREKGVERKAPPFEGKCRVERERERDRERKREGEVPPTEGKCMVDRVDGEEVLMSP